jgi:hypothetical protein
LILGEDSIECTGFDAFDDIVPEPILGTLFALVVVHSTIATDDAAGVGGVALLYY